MKKIAGLVLIIFTFCWLIAFAARPVEKSAEEWFDQGNQNYSLNQYQQAIEDYTNAIDLKPQFAGAYDSRGNAYQKLNRWDQAIQDYTKAIEINPQYANAYYQRGNTYEQLNQKEKAIESYRLFIKYADPNIRGKDIEAIKERILFLSDGK